MSVFIMCIFLLGIPCLVEAGDEDPVVLFQKGLYEEARLRFLDRLPAHPDDPEALYYLGRLSSEAALSKRYFERLLKVDSNHKLAKYALFELVEGEYSGPASLYLTARSRYRAFLNRYPKSELVSKALYRIGLTYLVARYPDSANVFFKRVMRQFPDSEVMPYVRLGEDEADAQIGTIQSVRKKKK